MSQFLLHGKYYVSNVKMLLHKPFHYCLRPGVSDIGWLLLISFHIQFNKISITYYILEELAYNQ